MLPLSQVWKTGMLIGALAGGAPLLGAGEAEASERKRGKHSHPTGWRVRVTPEAQSAKHGMYSFTVTVRDDQGQPVDDAEVFLRLHSFETSGHRLVPAKRQGRGWYRAHGHLKPGLESPNSIGAVVRPVQ